MKLTFNDTFNLSTYGGKLFQADPVKLDYSLDIPDVETATPEGKEVQKLVNAAWTAKMASWKKDKEKEYKEILKATEKALLETSKKKAPEFLKANKGDKALAANKLMQWLSEEAKGANVMIKNALTTFESVCQKYMVELWTKVAATIDKKFKTAIRNAKIKAALKIVGLSIVIIAAAALTIAGAVLAAVAAPSGVGVIAGLGLAAGGIATLASAIGQIYGVVDKTWPDHKKAAKNVKAKMEILKTALEYEAQKALKDKKDLGPKEKIKLMLGNVKGKKKDVEDALKALEMWTGKMQIDIEKSGQVELKISAELAKLATVLKTATDDKQIAEIKLQQATGEKHVKAIQQARTYARGYLEKYAASVAEAQKVLADEGAMASNTSKLGTAAGKIETLMNSKEVETLITVGKGGVEFLKGFLKFAK